jgi:HD-GYP domain-containing protein (c-di-GMP phosphodiesterase class II)
LNIVKTEGDIKEKRLTGKIIILIKNERLNMSYLQEHSADNGASCLENSLSEAVMSGPDASARDMYQTLLDYLQRLKGEITSHQPPDIETAFTLVKSVIDQPEIRQRMTALAVRAAALEADYMVSHQVNTMIVTLKMGDGLGYDKDRVLELGVSALLHDVGMFILPKEILNKSSSLTAKEIEIMQDHSETGRDILMPFGGKHPWLPEVVYQHHERGNGTGYPRGLRAKDIHEFAQVISLIDGYEAMTHHRPNRQALKQSFTAKELIAQSRDAAFPPHLVKTFLKEITLYPEGSCVVLNNKLVCEVIAIDRNNPLRPDLKILYDESGNRVRQDKFIKLKDNPLHFIVDTVLLEEPLRTRRIP